MYKFLVVTDPDTAPGFRLAGVEVDHGTAQARMRAQLTVADARALLSAGVLGAGSMAPKVESAVEFVAATGRRALILHTDALARAFAMQPPGTAVVP